MFLDIGSVIVIIFIVGVVIVYFSFVVTLEEEKNNNNNNNKKPRENVQIVSQNDAVNENEKISKVDYTQKYMSFFLNDNDLNDIVSLIVKGQQLIKSIENLKPKKYPTAFLREYPRILFKFYQIEQLFLKSTEKMLIEKDSDDITGETLGCIACMKLKERIQDMLDDLHRSDLGDLLWLESSFKKIDNTIKFDIISIASDINSILEKYKNSDFIKSIDYIEYEMIYDYKFGEILSAFYGWEYYKKI